MIRNVFLRGAHAPSRAADGASAVGCLLRSIARQRLFGRRRPNQHAKARALPGVCCAALPAVSSFVIRHSSLALVVACYVATATSHAITLDAALSRTLEKNPQIVQARLAL